MYSIELQTVFYEYQNKNHKIKTSFVSTGLRPVGANKTGFNRKAVNNTMRLIYIIDLIIKEKDSKHKNQKLFLKKMTCNTL